VPGQHALVRLQPRMGVNRFSGPSAAAAAVAGAPPASVGGPDEWSMERDDSSNKT